jgi:hypothetical protein
VRTFGNRIFIPNFGTVALAEVEVGIKNEHSDFRRRNDDRSQTEPSDSNYFTLDMLKMHLGCPASGASGAGGVNANGQMGPPG